MTKFLGPIGSVLITFFVTLFLNTVANYYADEKGAIGLSRPIEINNARFVIMTIENHSADFLTGIVIEVPTTVPATSIVADPAISVDEIASSPGKQKLLRIGQISPRVVSRLFIPVPNGLPETTVRLVNREASGVRLRQEDHLESPLRSALLSALFSSVLYALIMSIFAYFMSREYAVIKAISDGLKVEVEDVKTRLESTRGDLERELNDHRRSFRTLLGKQRVLLQARLFDYSKELDFWRNAVSALLLSRGGDKRSAEELIAKVTEALGTHGTKSSANSYESVQIAARWLVEAERSGLNRAETI